LVQIRKRTDGGSGLCSGSAHSPPCYCERYEFYLLAGYKHYIFACLFIRLCITWPPCPRSDAGTSLCRSSLTWQSGIRSVLQRGKQRRRKPAPGPKARVRLAGMGTWAHPSFGSPSQAGPSEIWGGCRTNCRACLDTGWLCGEALSPAWLLSPKPRGLFSARVYLDRRKAAVWDEEGFVDLFSKPPKLRQQPAAPAEEGGFETKSVTRWRDAGMLFSWILPVLTSQPRWTEEKGRLPGAGAGAKQCHKPGWDGNTGQDLSHLLQGSCAPSSILGQV